MSTIGRRRALGQHFLKDSSVIEAICNAICEKAHETHCTRLLEIGPGRGAITLPLLQMLQNYPELGEFSVVEKDRKLAEEWASTWSSNPRPGKVIARDFMEVPESEWLGDQPLAVVSNLPYSAGTAILTRLAEHPQKIKIMVLMFQKEVAERVRAKPSTKAQGSLSLWIQNRWDVSTLLSVPPKAFIPPPKVQSEVIVLTPRQSPRISMNLDSIEELDLWQSLLKHSFAHRRKMLRSVLPWRNALELSQVDGTKRAEALDWNEWDQLFQVVKKVVLVDRDKRGENEKR